TITELFEAQAAASSGAPAISFKNTTITYRELNERANRLAHWLRAAGVNPGSAVAVIQERSTELIVSLLAILKAGGAYVSIDPAYPMERLQLMWREIQPRAALTQNKFYALTSKLPGNIPAICVDQLHNIQQQSGERPANGGSPESIAYISFTSGSTGRPKGVCVPH